MKTASSPLIQVFSGLPSPSVPRLGSAGSVFGKIETRLRAHMMGMAALFLLILPGPYVYAALPGIYSFQYDGNSYSVTVGTDGRISRVYLPGYHGVFSGSEIKGDDLKLAATGYWSDSQLLGYFMRRVYGTSFSVTYDGIHFQGSLSNFDNYYGDGPSGTFVAKGPFIVFDGGKTRSVTAKAETHSALVIYNEPAGGMPPLVSSEEWLHINHSSIVSPGVMRIEFAVDANHESVGRKGFLTFDYNGVYSTTLEILQSPPAPEITVEQGEGSDIDLENGKSNRDFGSVKVGKSSKAMVFTIRNDGTAPLIKLDATIKGRRAIDFKIVKKPSATLAIGKKTKFKVMYKPAKARLTRATLQISSNDKDERPFRVKLAGKGVK